MIMNAGAPRHSPLSGAAPSEVYIISGVYRINKKPCDTNSRESTDKFTQVYKK